MKNHRRIFLLILGMVVLVFNLMGQGLILANPVQPDLKLESEAAILMEPVTGEILFEKNPDRKMHPASVTKLMVMYLVLEALNRGDIKLTDVVTASPEACKMGGSQIWLEPGEQMTVDELLKAVSIVSANDASYALGEQIAGSEENFITLMNKRAKELGLRNTSYVNTTGLEPNGGVQGNLTSVRDMAILAREVLKYPMILKWTGTWIDHLRGGKSFLRNTNKLVRFYRGCDGLKTGFTGEAGYCLVATAKRDNVRMIAVVMKAATDKARAQDISKLFNYGFSLYKAYQVYRGGEEVSKVRVFRGAKPYVSAKVANELTAVLKRSDKGDIQKRIIVNQYVKAPVKAGDKVGKVEMSFGGKICGEVDLIAGDDVKRASIFQIWSEIFRNILSGAVGKVLK